MEALVHCHVRSWVSFGLVHATNATLAFLCFLGTFPVKSWPGGYNGARGLTFAMLAYFITWVSFVPLCRRARGLPARRADGCHPLLCAGHPGHLPPA